MAKKFILFTLVVSTLSGNMLSDEIQEVIVLEKKLSSLNGWSNNQSITSINEKELENLDAQHPKQIFRRSPGVWISRGSGQEHLTAIRSPVLAGPGACGSFLILEDGIPIRPTGFCNVNGLFETPFEIASGVETITGPASARYGANAMHGVINILSKPIIYITQIVAAFACIKQVNNKYHSRNLRLIQCYLLSSNTRLNSELINTFPSSTVASAPE